MVISALQIHIVDHEGFYLMETQQTCTLQEFMLEKRQDIGSVEGFQNCNLDVSTS